MTWLAFAKATTVLAVVLLALVCIAGNYLRSHEACKPKEHSCGC